MPGYENAPATRLLATRCAVCSRPLVDAKSVDLGIGPDCRRRYGFDQHCSEEARKEANVIVYHIAAKQDGMELAPMLARLNELGFNSLADRIADRIASVKITVSADGRIEVVAPYNPDALNLFRAVSGRRWEKARKVTSFPMDSKRAVFVALQTAYAGQVASGPKGLFVL